MPHVRGEEVRAAETVAVTLTPNWEGLRAFVRHVFRTDPKAARAIAAEMGCEAPDLPQED